MRWLSVCLFGVLAVSAFSASAIGNVVEVQLSQLLYVVPLTRNGLRRAFIGVVKLDDQPLNFRTLQRLQHGFPVAVQKLNFAFRSLNSPQYTRSARLRLRQQNLIYFEPGISHYKIPLVIARLGLGDELESLQVKGRHRKYEVFPLTFVNGIILEKVTAEVSPLQQPGYALDITVAQNRHLRTALLQALRTNLPRSKGVFPVSYRRLKRRWPALKTSMREVNSALRRELYKELGAERAELIKTALVELEKKMYRMADDVDQLPIRSRQETALHKAGERTPELIRSLSLQEKAEDRLSVLTNLFYVLVQEMEAAKATDDDITAASLASQALRTMIEMYLIAGRTRGRIGRQQTYSAVASFISSALLAGAYLHFENFAAWADHFDNGLYVDLQQQAYNIRIALAAATSVMFGNTLYQLVHLKNGDEGIIFFPGIARRDRKKAARYLRGGELRRLLLANLKGHVFPAEPYRELLNRPRGLMKGLNNADDMIQMIKKASGLSLSRALRARPCELLLLESSTEE